MRRVLSIAIGLLIFLVILGAPGILPVLILPVIVLVGLLVVRSVTADRR